MSRLTEEEISKMQEDRDDGMGIRELAEKYNLSPYVISSLTVSPTSDPENKFSSDEKNDFATRWNETRFRVLEGLKKATRNSEGDIVPNGKQRDNNKIIIQS